MNLRWMFGALSPAGRRARLSVLIFHRVLPSPDPLMPGEPDAVLFDAQLQFLKRWFDILPLPDAVTALLNGRLPARALAITFDDGYADNCSVALPILTRHALPATFFLTTAYLNGGRMWNDTVIEALRSSKLPSLDLNPLGLGTYPMGTASDRRTAIASILAKVKYLPMREREAKVEAIAQLGGGVLPNDLMLTPAQVLQLQAARMSIGAHTVNHPILARLSDSDAWDEIASSKQTLERILGEPVRLFAFPNGKPGRDYVAKHVRMAREIGFDAAFSTANGTARTGHNPYEIPRFTPWDRTPLRYGLRMAQNLARRDISTCEGAS